jgi:GDP-D-mannose dehydratase
VVAHSSPYGIANSRTNACTHSSPYGIANSRTNAFTHSSPHGITDVVSHRITDNCTDAANTQTDWIDA